MTHFLYEITNCNKNSGNLNNNDDNNREIEPKSENIVITISRM